MKPRLMDVMGGALTLVRQSKLAEATALLRDALSGGGSREPARAPESSPPAPALPAIARPPSARRPLSEVLQALRAVRARTTPAPDEAPQYPLDDKFTARNYRGAAGSLSYRLYVPSGLAERNAALVIMLHGCTQNPEDFAVGTQMNRLADEFGLIVAYPRQPQSANPSSCWNWFDKRHQHRGSGEPAKLAGLAQSLAGEFGVRKERVFVAGLSAGGAMAEVLAETYPDVFAAAGIHSGLAYQSASDVPSAFAAMKGTTIAAPALRVVNDAQCRKIVFHGGADATVNPINAERILEETRRSPTPLKEVDLESDIDGRRVRRTVLQDPEGRAVHEQWVVEGGGHAWFGGDSRGSYTQSVGLDASRVMVRFFLQE